MKEKGYRKVPFKNYLILGLLLVLVVALLWYFSKWYQVVRDYQNEIPIIRGTLSEISDLELEHYILENPTTILYVCTSSDNRCRSFEKSFKNILENDEELKEDIIYLNLSETDDAAFVQKFNKMYPYKISLKTDFPAFVLFEDSKITGLLQATKEENLDAREVRSYLKLHKMESGE